MKTSVEMKKRINFLRKKFIVLFQQSKNNVVIEKEIEVLEKYLPQVESLEKENDKLKAENKKWNKEFDKYDF